MKNTKYRNGHARQTGSRRSWSYPAMLLCASGIMATSLQAQRVFVNWNGDYVKTAQDLEGKNALTETGLELGGGAGNDSRSGRPFSISTPMNPANVPPGTYAGVSDIFYGGASAEQLNGVSAGWESFQVSNQGPNDQIHFRTQQGNQQHTVHLVTFWDRANFLGLQPTEKVALDTESSFLINIHNANSSMNDATGRWVVREGGNFYLSQTTFVPDNGLHTLSAFTAASDGNWAPYSPSGLALDFNGTGPSFVPKNFTDITAVGFFVEHDTPHDNYDFAVDQFTVSAVPESGTVGASALTLGGIAALYLRRRQARLKS